MQKKINSFISGVLGGKKRISALPNKDTEIPQISADDDCAAIHASMDITAEDGEDALVCYISCRCCGAQVHQRMTNLILILGR